MDKKTILITTIFGIPALFGLTTSLLAKNAPNANVLPIKHTSNTTQTFQVNNSPTTFSSTSSATTTKQRTPRNIRFGESEGAEE